MDLYLELASPAFNRTRGRNPAHFLLFSRGQFAFSQPPEFGRFAPGQHFKTKGVDY